MLDCANVQYIKHIYLGKSKHRPKDYVYPIDPYGSARVYFIQCTFDRCQKIVTLIGPKAATSQKSVIPENL